MNAHSRRLIFWYQAGLTRYLDLLIAVSQGLAAAVVILSAVYALTGEDHLRVLGALCGTIVWLYVGMAVLARRWFASILQLGVALGIYSLALSSVDHASVILALAYGMHGLWNGINIAVPKLAGEGGYKLMSIGVAFNLTMAVYIAVAGT